MTENQNENQDDYQLDIQDDNKNEKSNIGCRLFVEQIELILQMPESERKEFLWALIMNAYCRYKNQFENQTENQIECAYVSVSVSDSISVLNKFNKLIFNSMEKTVRFKKFSSNYGGSRKGSGRPAKKEVVKTSKIPTKEQIESFCNQILKPINTDNFIAYYSSGENPWCDKNGFPIDWQRAVISWYMREQNTPKYEKKEKRIF